MHCCNYNIKESSHMFGKLPIFNIGDTNGDTETKKTNKKIVTEYCSDPKEGKPRLKPPIILIYTNNCTESFLRVAACLGQILLADTYTIGHLSSNALENHPWINENCACLLITQTENCFGPQAWTHLREYCNKDGKIFFLCSNTLPSLLSSLSNGEKQNNVLANILNEWTTREDFRLFLKNLLLMLAENKHEEFNQSFISEDYPFSASLCKKKDQQMMFLTFEKNEQDANTIFSDSSMDELVGGQIQNLKNLLERLGVKTHRSSSFQPPKLTQGYLIFQKDRLLFDIQGMNYGTPCGQELKLLFESSSQLTSQQENGQEGSLPTPTSALLPIEIRQKKDGLPICAGFDSHRYFSNLRTISAGRALVYLPVCETTLKVSKSLSDLFPDFNQFIMVAGRQTKGKGRGGNEWISPRGCSMVTFNYNIPMNSQTAKSINFVQHITAVAAIDAATMLIGDKDFPLKIKWPNDLYYKRSRKMGGVLVSACCRNDRFECMISCGLNVENSQPNSCVNDFLTLDSHRKLHIEEFIAELMNKFEYHLHLFETKGKEEFLKKYCAKWMHSNEEVDILGADGSTERVIIIGLDSDGYLKVKQKPSGLVFSVQDDGNSFDMLNGLIHTKH